jgi:hypothetical protein
MPAEGLRGGFQADQRRPIMKSHRVAGVLARRGPRHGAARSGSRPPLAPDLFAYKKTPVPNAGVFVM